MANHTFIFEVEHAQIKAPISMASRILILPRIWERIFLLVLSSLYVRTKINQVLDALQIESSCCIRHRVLKTALNFEKTVRVFKDTLDVNISIRRDQPIYEEKTVLSLLSFYLCIIFIVMPQVKPSITGQTRSRPKTSWLELCCIQLWDKV